MKKIISLIAISAIFTTLANAELLKNFKYDGSLEVNAYNVDNADFDKNFDDKVGDVDTRLMLNMGFDLNNDANAIVSIVKNNRQWGTGSEDANTIQSNLLFQQAYLNLKNIIGLNHKIGRQYYGNPGDMVIYFGPKMWPYDQGLTVDAIDAWTGWYKNDKWEVNALLGKRINGAGTPNTDINLSGINAKTKIDRFNLNAYYYYQDDKNTTPGKSDYLGVLGIRSNWECMFVKNLNFGLEYDMNTGKDTNTGLDHQGYAYKLDAKYNMNLAGNLAFNGTYLFTTGDDNATDTKDKVYTSINGDYRPGIIYNGYGITAANLDEGSGVNMYNLGANWTPAKLEKLNIAFDYYSFGSDKETANTKKTYANEMDLVATWTHSDNISLKGYYAMFNPEKKNITTISGNDDSQTMLGASFIVKF